MAYRGTERFTNACNAQAQASSGLNDEQRQQQQTFLREAIASTPYSAVVQLVDVEVQPVSDDPSMQWHIFSADVLEVLRSQHTPAIRYAMAVERGEEPVLSEGRILLTLCRTEEGTNAGPDYY